MPNAVHVVVQELHLVQDKEVQTTPCLMCTKVQYSNNSILFDFSVMDMMEESLWYKSSIEH